MQKKTYREPVVEVVSIGADVICSSTTCGTGDQLDELEG